MSLYLCLCMCVCVIVNTWALASITHSFTLSLSIFPFSSFFSRFVISFTNWTLFMYKHGDRLFGKAWNHLTKSNSQRHPSIIEDYVQYQYVPALFQYLGLYLVFTFLRWLIPPKTSVSSLITNWTGLARFVKRLPSTYFILQVSK